MKDKKVLETIQQSWIHSHEEDTNDEMVYRPADYDFPLSRGREGFKLKPNHKMVEVNIAPTDGNEEDNGSWNLEVNDENKITLELNPDTSSPRKLHIKSIKQDRLTVEKE